MFCIHQILVQNLEYSETVHHLSLDFKKAYDLVRREVLYNILIEFGISMKLVKPIKMCLNETFNKVRVGKHLSDKFLIQNDLKQGGDLSLLLFNFALEYAVRKVESSLGRPRHKREGNIKMDVNELGWQGVDWIHLAGDTDQ
jgi:hypothetical protein